MLAHARKHWPVLLLAAGAAVVLLSSARVRVGPPPRPAPRPVPRVTRGDCVLYYGDSVAPAEAEKAADALVRCGWLADGRRHEAGLRREGGAYRLGLPVDPRAAADPAVLAGARGLAAAVEAAGLAPAEVELDDPDGRALRVVTPERSP